MQEEVYDFKFKTDRLNITFLKGGRNSSYTIFYEDINEKQIINIIKNLKEICIKKLEDKYETK